MIHREGLATIFITVAVLFGLNWAVQHFLPEPVIVQQLVLFVSTVFLLIILQFFRNPPRHTVLNEQHVISPADGKVVVIEEVEEPEYFKGKRLQISVFMSPFNVHVNRNPVSGIVSYFKYHPGKYLVAWHPKSSTENERTTTVIKTKSEQEVLFRQIAGALAKRICWYVKEGQPVQQGGEMGFIKFGSRVDIFLPLDAKVNVQLNQKVTGGETVLAEI
ncbi:MAG: phosphatidylserine decarboxylase family protein [Bacteroidia bacterium]|nr:phosphatidylserine decarboxylase family protein [Bacteroidia bacterium]MBP7261408.1 phosphatidylserine decarboxylase family protein [Bacteroidia bacterium]MBP9180967.1 phosphatidylserine decarboxylase family protein [Bacteroidia bacterium]MBP9725071.1 phosphatidylserine decarboxylase family protein [Bacteroidia bacterium]